MTHRAWWMAARIGCVPLAVEGSLTFAHISIAVAIALTVVMMILALAVHGYLASIEGGVTPRRTAAGEEDPWRRRARTARTVMTAVIVTWASVGLVRLALSHPWTLLAVVGLVAAVGVAARMQPPSTTAAVRDLVETILKSPGRRTLLVQQASNDQLCRLWDCSGREIRRVFLPSSLSAYADLRRSILDELESRYPEAITSWLAQSGNRDLGPYLKGQDNLS